MVEVKIPYSPRTWARKALHEVVGAVKRFMVMVIHRRGGKTTAVLNHLLRDAIIHKGHRYAYIAPLRNQAKRIAWEKLKQLVRNIPGADINESELIVRLPSGSSVEIYGADNADALRGIGLNGVALDEYAQMSPIVFSEIITKCVADTLGYVIILGTPKGKGHFYRVYQAALQDPKMWGAIFLDIDQSLAQEKGRTIENLRQALADDKKLVEQGIMTQEEFDQEWYLSWEAALKGAVYAKQIAEARKKRRIGHVPHDPQLPVFTIHDLGIGDAHAIIFCQAISPREVHIIDYYETTGAGYPEIAATMKKKPYTYAMHYFPFDIKNREQSTGLTRLATMEQLLGKDRVDVVPKLPEEDGIDLARAMWNRLFVDESVDKDGTGGGLFLDIIGSHIYEFDEGRGVFRSKTKHDFASHCGAALRYMAAVEKDLLRVIRRDDERERARRQPMDTVKDEHKGDLLPKWAQEDEDAGPSEDELARM